MTNRIGPLGVREIEDASSTVALSGSVFDQCHLLPGQSVTLSGTSVPGKPSEDGIAGVNRSVGPLVASLAVADCDGYVRMSGELMEVLGFNGFDYANIVVTESLNGGDPVLTISRQTVGNIFREGVDSGLQDRPGGNW